MAKKVEVELIFDASGKGVKAIRTADGELLNLERSADKVDKKTGRLSTSLKVGLAAALIGVAAAARKGFRVLNESIELAGIQQIAERKLEAALRNVGVTSEETANQLKQLAAETQNVSNFGDEAIITAQAMLLSFKSAGGPEGVGILTPRLVDLAAGLSKVSGETVDLNQAAQSIGKVFDGGASALKRYGISLSAAQEEAFKTAEGLDRVNLIAEVLDDNFKGLAAATINAGTQMNNAIGDLKESLGSELLPEIEGLQREVTAFVQDPRIIEFARKTGEAILNFGKGVVRFFQFSIPIALNRFKASFAEVSSSVVSGVGRIAGILANPLDAITGQDIANPFQSTIDNLNSYAQAARSVENELINLELQQSANAIQAAFFAEENRKQAESLAKLTQTTTEATSAQSKKKEADKEAVDVFAQVTQDLQAEADEYLAVYADVYGDDARRAAQEFTDLHVENVRRRLEAEQALTQATQEALAQQIGAADTSISSAGDVANAVVGSVRRVIQAKIGESIAKMLASLPFPTNLILGGAFAAVINALFNRLIPGFAEGVTNFRGGMALVGERGPELVNLPSGSNVITNENTQQILGRLDTFASSGADTVGALSDQTSLVVAAIDRLGERLAHVEARIDPFTFNRDMDRHNDQQRFIGNTKR